MVTLTDLSNEKLDIDLEGFHYRPGTEQISQLKDWFCPAGLFSLKRFAHVWKPVASCPAEDVNEALVDLSSE